MGIRHVVGPSDSLLKLAAQYGLNCNTIWDHPDNADLQEKRGNTGVLADGDVIVIPDRRAMQECAKGRKPLPAVYRLQQFRAEQPLANRKFRLEVHTAAARKVLVHEGTTNDQGVLEVPIPVDATEADLEFVYAPIKLKVSFGHANPVETEEGLRQRLESLGFPSGNLSNALVRFQSRFGLPVTGQADEVTLARLAEFCSTVKSYPPHPLREGNR